MKCAVCEQISEYEELIDFSKLEESDLGGQPKFSDGGSYENMVQCCPVCGYCNFDITKNVLVANKLLQTEGYQYVLHSEDMEKSVAKMVAVAYIYECQNSYFISAKAYSYASKMLELRGEKESSQMFKEQEVRLLLMHISTEYFKKHFDIKIYQYLIDALRRLKKFDKAISFCDVALTKTHSSVQRNIFLLEKSLCMNYISDAHEFSQSNGEFNNFYQILIQGFTGKQNESVYKNTYLNMRSYLEKSVYFPIAEGADFILRVEQTDFAGMDDMIIELTKTYDRVRGIETDIHSEQEEKAEIKQPKASESVKILTLSGIEKEQEENAEIEELRKALDAQMLKNQEQERMINIIQSEKEAVLEEMDILYTHAKAEEAQLENLKEEESKLKQTITELEKEKAEIAGNLEETIKSRRELTCEFDMKIYQLESENKELSAKIEEMNNLQEVEEIEPLEYATEKQNDTTPEFFKSESVEFESTYEEEMESETEEELPEDFQEEIEEQTEESEAFEEEITEEVAQSNKEETGEDEEDMAEFVLDDITEDMILNIANISGQIDVSEVQGMLLVGYKDAKNALDKISADGKLEEIEEDVYKHIEV